MHWSWLMVVLIGIGSFAADAKGSGPADDLFRLVPPDSGLTLAVEDLRGHAREIRESSLVEGLGRLEAVRAWLGSERFRGIERTSKEVQEALGVKLEVIVDNFLGDALILALRPGPADRPDQAQGLLLVRPRDRELVVRLLQALNQAQSEGGELERVDSRTHATLTYQVRRFKADQRPP